MTIARSREKQFAIDEVENNRDRISAFHRAIWDYAEPAWREYRSAKAYIDLLRAEGFEVEDGSGQMPTAFCATWGEGGPLIGSYAEYDAVPGNSQAVVPERQPRAGLHPATAGHTDPHSMLGSATLAGIVAAKRAMERHNLPGRLIYYGEPAEKVCGSKPIHAAKGYYDGVDAFIAYHPWPLNSVAWETHFGAYWSAVFTFTCPNPDAWIDRTLMPTGRLVNARCPGAVDALMNMYMTTKQTKEAMLPYSGLWTINEFILTGGDATSDNLPPKFAQIQYAWRTSDLRFQEHISRILEKNAKAAAEVTGCEVSVQWVSKTRVGLPNLALAELTYQNLQEVGAPVWDDEAIAFGQALQANLGWKQTDFPFLPAHRELTTPAEFEAGLRAQLPPGQLHLSGDDYVEYCWHAPTVRLFTARPTLAAPVGQVAPNWSYLALGGHSAVMDPGLFVAGKTIAATILDLVQRPELLARCQAEFVERTGGGRGGDKWVGPLLPADIIPPIDLAWPEYVTTERGREWMLPTPIPGAAHPL